MKRIVIPRLSKILFFVVVFFAILGITKVVLWGQSVMRTTGLTPMTVVNLLVDMGVDLKSQDGRTNILLLGIGGGNHEGADLTDTMIILSVSARAPAMSLVSVPRDIWSDTLRDKVNSAYYYGEEKKAGGGLVLAKAAAEEIVGLPIQYALLIDFSQFRSIIDLVGGITVDVPRAFVDAEYPIEGKEDDPCDGDGKLRCRYETISFPQGTQRMSGEQALRYVRSRHSQGDEGSDFARSLRQQEILLALKQEFVKPQTWLSMRRTAELLGAFDRASDTDMNMGELLTVGKIISRTPNERIKRISIESLLTSPPLWVYGRYVLVPLESWEVVHDYIQENLD